MMQINSPTYRAGYLFCLCGRMTWHATSGNASGATFEIHEKIHPENLLASAEFRQPVAEIIAKRSSAISKLLQRLQICVWRPMADLASCSDWIGFLFYPNEKANYNFRSSALASAMQKNTNENS